MIDRDAIDFQDKDIVLENKHMDLIMKNNQLPLEADIIIKSYPKIEWTLEKCYKEKDDWYFELRGFFDRGIRRVKVKCGEIYRIMGLSVYKFILSCDITEEGSMNHIIVREHTNVDKDVIGKRNYNYDGIEFFNGMQVEFHDDENPMWRKQILTVMGVDTDEGISFKQYRGRRRKNGSEEELDDEEEE